MKYTKVIFCGEFNYAKAFGEDGFWYKFEEDKTDETKYIVIKDAMLSYDSWLNTFEGDAHIPVVNGELTHDEVGKRLTQEIDNHKALGLFVDSLKYEKAFRKEHVEVLDLYVNDESSCIEFIEEMMENFKLEKGDDKKIKEAMRWTNNERVRDVYRKLLQRNF